MLETIGNAAKGMQFRMGAAHNTFFIKYFQTLT
jgi:hypothetical protein